VVGTTSSGGFTVTANSSRCLIRDSVYRTASKVHRIQEKLKVDRQTFARLKHIVFVGNDEAVPTVHTLQNQAND